MKWSILLIVFLLLQSCIEKELEVEIPFEGQKLVIEGFINPSESIRLKVYRTLPPVGTLEVADKYVSTATVRLFEDGVFIENLTYQQDGLYQSTTAYKPKFGKTYHVEVTAPDFPTAISQPEILPDSVPTFRWSLEDSTFVDNNNLNGILTFQFDDIENEANYYEIIIEGINDNEMESITWLEYNFALAGGICNQTYGRGDLITDGCFQDDIFLNYYTVDSRYFSDGSSPTTRYLRYNTYNFSIRTVSKTYFDYYNFLSVNDDNNFFIIEPTEIYTNIEGGYGVFAAYLERREIVVL